MLLLCHVRVSDGIHSLNDWFFVHKLGACGCKSHRCNITSFKNHLRLFHWRNTDINGTVNEIYETFLRKLTDMYDANFGIRKYILNNKVIKSSWIRKGLKRSSRKKLWLYIIFFRTKFPNDEFKYKNYISLFEKTSKKLK